MQNCFGARTFLRRVLYNSYCVVCSAASPEAGAIQVPVVNYPRVIRQGPVIHQWSQESIDEQCIRVGFAQTAKLGDVWDILCRLVWHPMETCVTCCEDLFDTLRKHV